MQLDFLNVSAVTDATPARRAVAVASTALKVRTDVRAGAGNYYNRGPSTDYQG